MVLASVIAGASGGALANVALSPLGGGAGLLQSYWYGAGLILGERMMYTFHWEKMKTRLDTGEDFLQVLESEMNPAITAIANYSMQVMKKTGAIYMQGGIDFMAKLIENMLKLLAGETIEGQTTTGGLVDEGVTVGGVTLPPVEVSPSPTPEPTLITDEPTPVNPDWPVGASPFLPQPYNSANPVATQAIARIDSVGSGFIIRIALTRTGTYENLWFKLNDTTYTSMVNAMAVAFTAWPDNLYKPILVGVGAFIVRR